MLYMPYSDLPADPSALSIFLLLVSTFQPFERLNILDGFKCFIKVVDYVSNKWFNVLLKKSEHFKTDRFKHTFLN